MSRMRREHYTCPRCGQENEFTMWRSLNGDMNPEAKRQLLDGTLFQVRCDHCGYETELVYTLLYHDMCHRVMVYFVDETGVERTRQLLAQARQTFESTTDVKLPPTRNRIVTSANDLREKAIIFEHELDDRVVEIIKAIYFAEAAQRYPEANIQAVYFMADDTGFSLQFFADEPMSADVPRELYEKLARDLAAPLEAAGDDEYVIDMHWAANFLHEGR